MEQAQRPNANALRPNANALNDWQPSCVNSALNLIEPESASSPSCCFVLTQESSLT